ncbi:hypothetical protein NG726_09395 [Pseudomonas sp. MOB-449]|nr:hypothetical protein [Pseudomonas sp. MOB-449]
MTVPAMGRPRRPICLPLQPDQLRVASAFSSDTLITALSRGSILSVGYAASRSQP